MPELSHISFLTSCKFTFNYPLIFNSKWKTKLNSYVCFNYNNRSQYICFFICFYFNVPYNAYWLIQIWCYMMIYNEIWLACQVLQSWLNVNCSIFTNNFNPNLVLGNCFRVKSFFSTLSWQSDYLLELFNIFLILGIQVRW